MNLMALNTVVELKDANSHFKVFNKYCAETSKPFSDLDELLEQLPDLNKELVKLRNMVESMENRLYQNQPT